MRRPLKLGLSRNGVVIYLAPMHPLRATVHPLEHSSNPAGLASYARDNVSRIAIKGRDGSDPGSPLASLSFPFPPLPSRRTATHCSAVAATAAAAES